MKMGTKLLYSADTKEYPGKVLLRFVTFSEMLVDKNAAEFLDGKFDLCDMNDPRVRQFKELV